MVLLARKCLFALTSSLILMCAVSVPAGSSAVEGGASAAAARADEVRYGTASWDAAAYGNHRAVVRVDRGAAAVRARIPWRRRDAHPEKKNVVIIDAATGARVRNVCPIAVNREYGDLAFQPATVPGDYYLYYLTYVSKGSSHYPTVEYTPMELTAEDSWLKAWGLSPFTEPAADTAVIPQARIIEIQAIDDFNSFSPMEVIATAKETERLLSNLPTRRIFFFPRTAAFRSG